jgi:hypothetical protein
MSDSDSFGATLVGWIIFAILGFAVYGAYVAVRNHLHPATPVAAATPDYSAPHFRDTQEFAPLAANPRQVTLMTKTSWIPGDQKSGVLRYQVTLVVSKATTDLADSFLLKRLASCSFSIDLLDKHGFKLTTIPLKVAQIVDANGNVNELKDNDLMPMSRESYEMMSDSVSPTWNCF